MSKVTWSSQLTRFTMLVFLVLLALGQLQRVRLGLHLRFSMHEIIMLGFMILSLCSWNGLKKQVRILWIEQKRFVLSLGTVFIAILISLLFHTNNPSLLTGMLYFLRFILYMLFPLSLLVFLREKIVQHQELPQGMIALALSFATLGLIQYVFLPDTRFLLSYGWDNHYFRLISTLLDPPFTAAIISVGLLLLQPLISFSREKRVVLFLISILLLSLALTYSRAGYLAFGASSVLLAVLMKQPKQFLLPLMLALMIPFLPRPASEGARLERTASIFRRIEDTTQAIVIPRSLVFFTGQGWYLPQAQRENDQDATIPSHSSAPTNSYVMIWQFTGLIGLLAFGWLAVEFYRIIQPTPVLVSIYTMILVGAIFNNLLFYPWIMLLMGWILVVQLGLKQNDPFKLSAISSWIHRIEQQCILTFRKLKNTRKIT